MVNAIPTRREVLNEFKVSSVGEIPKVSRCTAELVLDQGGPDLDGTLQRDVQRLEDAAYRVAEGGKGADTAMIAIRFLATAALIASIIAVGVLLPPGGALIGLCVTYAVLSIVNHQQLGEADKYNDPFSLFLGSIAFPILEYNRKTLEENPEHFEKNKAALLEDIKRVAGELDKFSFKESTTRSYDPGEITRAKAYYAKFKEKA